MDIGPLVKGNGEMDEVEVEVVEAELSQAVVESCRYVLWTVLRVPELGCDEDVLTLEARDLTTKGLLEGFRNLLLVAIDLGEIQMTVANLEGLKNGSANLARLSLPGTKAQLPEKKK